MLGRVHVDVDLLRRDVEKQHEYGVPAVEQHVAKRLADGVGDQLVPHDPAVHVEVLLVRLTARMGRQPDAAVESHTVARFVDEHALADELRR
jgi:hypothetical protein